MMTAKNKALALLARQPYTEKRLAEKLLLTFPHDEVIPVIEWCIEQNYLNDREWALRKAEQRTAKGWNKYKISAYLRHYGISREIINEVLAQLKDLPEEEYEDDC